MAQAKGQDPFSALFIFFHKSLGILKGSEPDTEDPLPLFLIYKTDPFSYETHSFLLHFIIPSSSISLLLCVLLLAL